jgi:cell wall-associated NlpC family hydrolase
MNTLVEAARHYIGTRWRHRGRSVHSLDCAGLVVRAYADCGIELPDYTLYGREPHRDGLVRHAIAALGEPLVDHDRTLAEGDVLLMRFDREPHHMAIVALADYGGTPAFNIIHADGMAQRVHEQRLTPDMAARITHVFRRAI